MDDQDRIEEWLGRYRTAWKTDDPAVIASLFTDDVRYYSTPYRSPRKGREEVVDWWTKHGDSKVSWTFDHEVLAQEGDLFVVRGLTHYPEKTYHNIWLVTLAPDGRAREFIEYWMEER